MPEANLALEPKVFCDLKVLRCRALNGLLPHGHIFVEAPLCDPQSPLLLSHMGTVSMVVVAMVTHTFRPVEVCAINQWH